MGSLIIVRSLVIYKINEFQKLSDIPSKINSYLLVISNNQLTLSTNQSRFVNIII